MKNNVELNILDAKYIKNRMHTHWEKEIVKTLKDLIEYEEQFHQFQFQKDIASTIKSERLSDFVQPGAYILVLSKKNNDDVIGVIIVRTVKPAENLIGVLGFLNINKEFRNKGYGSYLLKEAESFLKKAGCKSISINVIEDNGPAKNFYAKHGYLSTQIQYAKII
jgi:ribosomal protein S18 acetylase RimI-like enzyme